MHICKLNIYFCVLVIDGKINDNSREASKVGSCFYGDTETTKFA